MCVLSTILAFSIYICVCILICDIHDICQLLFAELAKMLEIFYVFSSTAHDCYCGSVMYMYVYMYV